MENFQYTNLKYSNCPYYKESKTYKGKRESHASGNEILTPRLIYQMALCLHNQTSLPIIPWN